jgi:hypothetical protein
MMTWHVPIHPVVFPFIIVINRMAEDTNSSPYLMTIDQLVSQSSSNLSQEMIDSKALAPVIRPSTLVYYLPMWASVGFPDNCSILTINLNPPSPCPDGTPRTLYDYISFLISADLDGTISNLNTQLLGIVISYTLSGNSIRFSVSKS